jgi:hypothetical protein
MFIIITLTLGLIGVAVYLLVVFREVPGAVDERLGTLEALPEDIGVWKTDPAPAPADAEPPALIREVRLWHEPSGGLFGSSRLLRQVRYRDRSSGEIIRSDPDEVVKRRRVRS